MFDWFSKRADDVGDSVWISGEAGMLITGGEGFLGGTHVISNLGWRRVEALCVGDKVLTFDNGMRPIVDVQRETLHFSYDSAPSNLCPLLVPEGALLNRREMFVAPDQGIFIESELVCDTMGDPYAVVPARALVGFRGITQERPTGDFVLTTLGFSQDEVVYAEGGMLAYCPQARQILADDSADSDLLYNVLSLKDAKDLIQRLAETEVSAQIGWRAEEILAYTAARPGRPA